MTDLEELLKSASKDKKGEAAALLLEQFNFWNNENKMLIGGDIDMAILYAMRARDNELETYHELKGTVGDSGEQLQDMNHEIRKILETSDE